MSAIFRVLPAVVAICWWGCTSGDDDTSESEDSGSACVPGAVQSCPCGGGRPDGTQRCAKDGTQWESCQCVPHSGSDGDTDADVDTDTDTDIDTGISGCPPDSTPHVSSAGRTFCCPELFPTFCDEGIDGYAGGCWSVNVACDTILLCADTFGACPAGTLSHCSETGDFYCYFCPDGATRYETTSGRPVCCTSDRPTFCDEITGSDYVGGCWSANVDCETILYCNQSWAACITGDRSSCENNTFQCVSN